MTAATADRPPPTALPASIPVADARRRVMQPSFHAVRVDVDPETGDMVGRVESTFDRGAVGMEVARVTAARGTLVLCADAAPFWACERPAAISVFHALRWALKRMDGGRLRLWSNVADIGARQWTLIDRTKQFAVPFDPPYVESGVPGMRQHLAASCFRGACWTSLESADALVVHESADALFAFRRSDGALKLGACSSEPNGLDAYIQRFLCMREAVRCCGGGYDLAIEAGPERRWSLLARGASVRFTPGMCVHCLLPQLPARTEASLRAAFFRRDDSSAQADLLETPAQLDFAMEQQQLRLMHMVHAIAAKRRELHQAVTRCCAVVG
jgi:hypothetical protein